MNTGLRVPTRRMPWMTRPGSAPMYVRRWPRTSASSRTPPSETRMNSRPSERAIDLPSEVLPTPGGPTRQRIGPFLPGASLRTARYSRMRFFTFLQVVVIGVEDLARLVQVQPILGPLRPRQLDQPLEVGALHGVFGRRLRHLLEALELLARRLLDVGGHLGRLDLLVERVEVAGVFAFAQLVLDRLQLLAQDRLALVLRELLAHLRVDLLLDLDQLDLALQQHQQPAQPLGDVALDQQRGALLGRQVDGRRDDVAQAARVLVLIEHLRGLVRDVGRDRDELLGHVVHRHAQAVDLDRVLADLDQRSRSSRPGTASPA